MTFLVLRSLVSAARVAAALTTTPLGAGQLTGAVTLVARRGRVAHFEAHGVMNLAAKTPMRKNAVFRIASMSKPVTAVATAMLMEEGKVRLTDPVYRFIPSFKDTQVAVIKPGYVALAVPAGPPPPIPDYYSVPATREMTVKDLLTHTSGLESGSLGNRLGGRIAPRNVTKTLADQVPNLAKVPLDFQPGSTTGHRRGSRRPPRRAGWPRRRASPAAN